MDFTVSNQTLDCLEEVIYDINLELLKEVHTKFLSDLDFSELVTILENKKKKNLLLKKKNQLKKTQLRRKRLTLPHECVSRQKSLGFFPYHYTISK